MNKTFGIGKKIREQLFTEKERIEAPVKIDPYFIKLTDVFKSYKGKAGLLLLVNESETGVRLNDAEHINDRHYVHFQLDEETEWIVLHNLDKSPSVSILNDNGFEIEGEVSFLNNNSLAIRFDVPLSGIVCVN